MWIYWIISHGKPTRCSPPAWDLGEVLTTPHRKIVSCCKTVKESTCDCGNEPSVSIQCGEFLDDMKTRLYISQTQLSLLCCDIHMAGPSSAVGIATAYGLDGPEIESRWRRDFPHLSRPALRAIQPPVQWVPGLSPGVRCGRGVTLTPHPLLAPRSKISVELYLYSP
jgi:hypothetical protein